MIAILDTNVLISALIDRASLPAKLVECWGNRRFTVITCELQLQEFRRVSRYPKVAPLLSSSLAGRLVRRLRDVAGVIDRLPEVDRCRDPMDNYLLALAQAGRADFLVTGDKADLIALKNHGATQIVTVRAFADLLGF